MSKFYEYFKENMEALGLAAPINLFGTQQTTIATISTVMGFVDKFGTKVTVMDMAVAGTKVEQLTLVGAVSAAYFAGAAIGSLAVATGRTLAGGTSLADVMFEASKWKLDRQWLHRTLHWMPGIYDQSVKGRRHYKHIGIR